MCTEPHWTAYLTALLAPVVAVLGSFIAFRQWRLAQNKLKFDLFDRRLGVYKAATQLIATISHSGTIEDSDTHAFLIATKEAKWILNFQIADYLDKKIYESAIDLQTLNSELNGLQGDNARRANIEQQRLLKHWFSDQYPVIDQLFAPFLTLHH